MKQPIRVSAQLGGKEIIIETGKLAKQAGGSITIQCGDTIVLVTATSAPEPKEDIDFVPLSVDFIEKTFAAGKIPGGFFKREGKPTEMATLTSRFIDRPIRPMFPKGYNYETQVLATPLSVDPVNDPDVLAITGASAALVVSDINFPKPLAGCRVGRLNGQFVLNVSSEEMLQSDIDLIVVASEDAVVMVEGGAQEASEKDLIAAISFAHQSVKPLIEAQKELLKKVAPRKRELSRVKKEPLLESKLSTYEKKVHQALTIKEKLARYEAFKELKASIVSEIFPDEATRDPKLVKQIANEFEEIKGKVMRQIILKEKVRIDGRKYNDIRPISVEVGLLPRAHGSGLFTRGETQALVVATLGSTDDKQRIDSIFGESKKSFMLHYNFPPFSVGEVKFMRGPGRREIGHGALAERALAKVLPTEAEFPYTIRIVSEILESNGSSSMATVCGGTLSLMDAGVPIKAPVAGIAMGLIKEGKDVAILSDILGDEDHLGDMDFKVTGTAKGVTALQMDIKIDGVTEEILSKALDQAKEGRLFILGKMNEAISEPRGKLSQHAPKIEIMQVKKTRIKDVIGSGGCNIRNIVDTTGVKMDIEDDGTIKIFSPDQNAIDEAKKMVKNLTAEAEVGQIYDGVVKRIVDFGAFVEILPKTDGLVHISELANHRVRTVDEVVKEGDRVKVKCIGVDDRGKVRLSMKALLNG